MNFPVNNFNTENESSKTTNKQIYQDSNTGKIFMIDENNNKNEINKLGRQKTFFLPEITGVLSGAERKKVDLFKTQNNSIFSSNNKKTYENISSYFHSKRPINYYPKINRLDGFSFLPRPISLPFYNIPDYEIKNKLKSKINKETKKYYFESNNNLNINNKTILSYITKDLNEYNIGEKDKEKLINLINKNIDDIKEEYKIKLNAIEKDPNYIALIQFKKKLLLSTKNLNNTNISEAPKEIKNKFQIIKNVIKNNSVNRKNLINKKEKQYKYFKKNSKSNYKYAKIRNYKKNDLVIGPDKLNDICKSKDLSIGRLIKMDFGNFSYEEISQEKNNNTDIHKEENNENQTMYLLTKSSNNNNNIINRKSKENIFFLEKDTAETVTNMIRNNTDINVIGEKIEDDELSFISRDCGEDIKKNNNICKLKCIKKNYQQEKELLKGINKESHKEKIFMKPTKKILKNNGQLYREDLALLKITNPHKFYLWEKEEEHYKKLLNKKIEFSRKKYGIEKK